MTTTNHDYSAIGGWLIAVIVVGFIFLIGYLTGVTYHNGLVKNNPDKRETLSIVCPPQ